MNIKAIIFDVDGVLLPKKPLADYLHKDLHISPCNTNNFLNGIYHDCFEGKADLKVTLKPLLKKWKVNISVDMFLNTYFKACGSPNGELLSLIKLLRNKGIACCIGSNQEMHKSKYLIYDLQFDKMFDYAFFSYKIGSKKPNYPFYDYVSNTLEISADKILFWDDTYRNIFSAQKYGWNAKQYKNFEDFTKDLLNFDLIDLK